MLWYCLICVGVCICQGAGTRNCVSGCVCVYLCVWAKQEFNCVYCSGSFHEDETWNTYFLLSNNRAEKLKYEKWNHFAIIIFWCRLLYWVQRGVLKPGGHTCRYMAPGSWRLSFYQMEEIVQEPDSNGGMKPMKPQMGPEDAGTPLIRRRPHLLAIHSRLVRAN
mgnify:CR=1 FL=1